MSKEIPESFDELRQEFMQVATKRQRDMYVSLMDVNEVEHALIYMQRIIRESGEQQKKN